MKNTANNIIKINKQQKTEREANLFRYLNTNSQPYQHLRKSYIYVSMDDAEFDYFSLNDAQLAILLEDIKTCTQEDGLTVSYYLDQGTTVCLKVCTDDQEVIYTFRIHDLAWKETLEYILNIVFSPTHQAMQKVNNRSLGIRKAKKLRLGSATQRPTTIHESLELRLTEIFISDIQSLKSAIAHLDHVVDCTPDFEWLSVGMPQKSGKKYKILRFNADFDLELVLFSVSGKKQLEEYSAVFELGIFSEGRLDDVIFKNLRSINLDILKAFKLMLRGERIAYLLT